MAVATQTRQGFPWWLVLIQGIVAIILGGMLLAQPLATTVLIIVALGIYWFINGIMSIVSIFMDRSMWGWKLFIGILGIIAGFVVLDRVLLATFLVPTVAILVLGVEGIVMGVIYLIQAFQGAGWGAGILGVLSIIFGIILVANPLIAALSLPWVLGIAGIVFGIFTVIAAFRLR